MQNVEKPTSEELLKAVKDFLGDKKQETYETAIRTLLQVLEEDKSVMVPIHKTNVGSTETYTVPSTLSASNGKWYYIVYTSEREIPVGAAIMRGHEVLSVAHNERERNQDPTAHAEMLAIRRAA